MSNSSALDLDFEPLYTDPLVCIAPAGFVTHRQGIVAAEELRGQIFVSQRPDTDADIQSYLKKQDLRVKTRCYVNDDESTIAMVACGQGVAIMPELILKQYGRQAGEFDILRLEPSASRTIGLACLDKNGLSPAARQFCQRARDYAGKL